MILIKYNTEKPGYLTEQIRSIKILNLNFLIAEDLGWTTFNPSRNVYLLQDSFLSPCFVISLCTKCDSVSNRFMRRKYDGAITLTQLSNCQFYNKKSVLGRSVSIYSKKVLKYLKLCPNFSYDMLAISDLLGLCILDKRCCT